MSLHEQLAREFQIICTIGPASETYYVLSQMRKAGMTAARLNLSHYSLENAVKAIDLLRKTDGALPIVCDLKGPEVRIKNVQKIVRLKKNSRLTLSLTPSQTKPFFSRDLAGVVERGDVITANTGSLLLTVESVKGQNVVLSALNEGFLANNKSANVLNKELFGDFVTEEDKEAVALANEKNLELLAVSHVSTPEDVRKIRKISGNAFLAVKIENKTALNNADAIAAESDSIWIDRGDLTTSIPVEDVASATIRIAEACKKQNKPLWVATHILDSMITHSVPTTSNVTDIAFMLDSGASGLVLAGETAVGKFPVEAVDYAKRIVDKIKKPSMRHLFV